jgi:ribosome biogenesis SPOUT family RNA methylase Rps3
MEKQSPTYIIEHLELELFEWCIFEYEHMSELVGKENLWFTNIKNKKDAKKLEKYGKVFPKSIKELGKIIDFSRVCVLDPEAERILETSDVNNYDYFLFGGILGDYPPKKRTKKELTKFINGAGERHIGKEQMSTDNAVYTVKQILDGKSFSEMKFKDGISIKINDFENVDLPYRYNIQGNKIYLSPKIVDYLKQKQGF